MKMLNNTPRREITGTAFGNEHMNMRVPLETTTKGMKYTNKAGGKIF